MRPVLVAAAVFLTALTGCTTSAPSPPVGPSSSEMTPPPTPDFQTFVLRIGQNRLNLESHFAGPGDLVVCDGRRLRVPQEGVHRGSSGAVWAITSTTGSVSMGCRTQVAWGHLTISY